MFFYFFLWDEDMDLEFSSHSCSWKMIYSNIKQVTILVGGLKRFEKYARQIGSFPQFSW